MPTYRSITISLISQFDLFTIPEYPPPPTSKDPFFTVPTLVSPNGVVSVYIPTYPSSQFWISYSISPPHPPNALYFFKLFINGSCAVSWGCGKEDGYKGKTMFALYESNETRIGKPAPERRVLCFGSESGSPKSGFGDVMELRVYRSKGRKKTQPIVEPFRDSYHGNDKKRPIQTDNASINLAHAGKLVEGHPRNFYRYALIDPLDQPFATFRYFYCDWSQLQAIGVISPPQSAVSSIRSYEPPNSIGPHPLAAKSFLDLTFSHASLPLSLDSLTPLSKRLSYTSHSPPPAGQFEPQTPSPIPKDIRKIYHTVSPTRSRPLVSAMKGRSASRATSAPDSFLLASLVRRSPSPVKMTSSRLFSQSPTRFSKRSSSLGALKDVVNSAVRRRAKVAAEDEDTIDTRHEPASEIRRRGRRVEMNGTGGLRRSTSVDPKPDEIEGSDHETERERNTASAKKAHLWLDL